MTEFNKDAAYNQLPFIPPQQELETPELFKRLISAHRELSGVKGELRSLPNPEILFTTLPIQEAKESVEIENIVTTTDSIYEALSESESMEIKNAQISESVEIKSTQIKEVLYYREAVRLGLDFLKNNKNLITINLCKKICSVIKNKEMDIRKTPVGLRNIRNNEIIYTPPDDPSAISKLLTNWAEFINMPDDDLDVLTKLAIMHYQFEAIHPFGDGNGRTGRIINTLFLIQNKLIDQPVLYLSRYFNRHRQDYYSLLNSVTSSSDWLGWILFVIKGVEITSRETRKNIEEINQLFKDTIAKIKEIKINNAQELSLLIFKNPYCRLDHFIKQNLGTRMTGAKHLDLLVKHGILRKEKRGRNNLYINIKLYDLMLDLED